MTNRTRLITLFLAAMFAVALVAAPLLADPKAPADHNRVSGTVASVSTGGGKTTITLTNGVSVSVTDQTTHIVDARNPRRTKATVASLVAGTHVVIRTRGNVTHIRIRR